MTPEQELAELAKVTINASAEISRIAHRSHDPFVKGLAVAASAALTAQAKAMKAWLDCVGIKTEVPS